MSRIRLEMKGITKSFGGVQALKGVDFSVNEGEIHALLGENGAGKSTLMNILGGVIPADAGEIWMDGRPVRISSPQDSKRCGISFIHQELNLIPDMTVYENLFLGSEMVSAYGFVDAKRMIQETRRILDMLGVQLDPEAIVGKLDASLKQVIEIAKSLLNESNIIIMDEPTTSLTDREIQHIFHVMRTLRSKGVSIIFISHKLQEVIQFCDRYTVLRDGELSSTGRIADTDEEKIAQAMVGKEVLKQQVYRPRALGEVVLEANGLHGGAFHDIRFTLRKGEILGFTGLSGAGHSELMEALFGYRPKTAGEVWIKGRTAVIRHPKQALASGLGFVPKNRKESAIIKDMSILENFTLASLGKVLRFGFIERKREREKFQAYREQINIKAGNPELPITSLSGGNQQKVILAKWLEADADIIILDNPTQGVDVGAKSEIYQLILELAEKGKSFIVLSSEIPEIQKLCDRVVVMYQGRVTAILDREEATEGRIMMYATGAKSQADTA
ncbi:sugar ABC transporter ATP-binding protein [Brevibacillus sp. SYP-B805]|uniref:sugar ABC transporter ATP-binding protein n=1 Tax=Brevibacillus sp. SYP-B805 TaxID=1578199 RepID=UPI0013ED8798|nr:sugar ABC transporter ATP-binding protein [Brevibacillus sp. SYP-B805]NGQ96521.1 sugar ABC transporter ATP-binding protein [Brevibacillus sp. SYP-B805]